MAYSISRGGLGSDSPGESLRVGWPMNMRAGVRATTQTAQQNDLQKLTSVKPAVRPSNVANVRAQMSPQARPTVPARFGPIKPPPYSPPNATSMLSKIQAAPAKAVFSLENRSVAAASKIAAERSVLKR